MFGMLHIFMGLTMPYSLLSQRVKAFQTGMLSCGLIAMGPIMIIRSNIKPTLDLGLVELLLGSFMLSAFITTDSYLWNFYEAKCLLRSNF